MSHSEDNDIVSEHTEPTVSDGPNPLLAPLHQGQMNLLEIEEADAQGPSLPSGDAPDAAAGSSRADSSEALVVVGEAALAIVPEGTDFFAPEPSDDFSEWPTLDAPGSSGASSDVPFLDRDRPRRPSNRRGVAFALLAIVAALLIGTGVWYAVQTTRHVEVPSVVNRPIEQARSTLDEQGLRLEVVDRLFSDSPVGTVLSQTPSAGSVAVKGSVVELAVSAGTEDLTMPDLVGLQLPVVEERLKTLGMSVVVEQVRSRGASGTVLSTVPAAGSTIRTGDRVRIQVAASASTSGGALVPYGLGGISVIIDPAPVAGEVDVPMEVARRLRALLEASGAQVTVLRSSADASASDADRARAAGGASGTIALGLSLGTGEAGMRIGSSSSGAADAVDRSKAFASGLETNLRTFASPVSKSAQSSDAVFGGMAIPWVRLTLGSSTARADQTQFADPAWSDKVARACYQTLGQLYGVQQR